MTNREGLESAFRSLESSLGSEADSGYYRFHEPRYRHCIQAVTSLAGSRARILDVGSHYLHQAAVLQLLGFQVSALDVPEFANLPSIRERGRRFSIEQHQCSDLSKGDFLSHWADSSFDVVLFCEILEHITFNPVDFWRRIYDLLSPGGFLFITTPNSLRWLNIASSVKRIMLCDGIGIDVPSIYSNVTYGHHWKEYSKREIIRYFAMLSPDFEVEVSAYSYREHGERELGIKAFARRALLRLGKICPFGAEELQVVVRLAKKTQWLARGVNYG